MLQSGSVPFISILIVNYNGKEHLKKCFESLYKMSYENYEIILIDNSSKDNSIAYTRKHYPKVKVLSLEKNYGFAEGNNRGVNEALGDYIVFLNNDTVIQKKWLSELVNALKIHGDDTIFTSKVLFYDNPLIINTIGGFITPIGGGFDIGLFEEDVGNYDEVDYVGSPAGCSMLIKKSLFKKLGGFDKDYFAYFEDTDLGWRSWLFGYKVLTVQNSIVYHKFGGTAGKLDNSFRIYHGQKNRIMSMIKNFSLKYLILGFSLSFIYDLFRIINFIFHLQFDLVFALIKGNHYVINNYSKIIKKRQFVQLNRKINDDLFFKEFVAPISLCIKEYRKKEAKK